MRRFAQTCARAALLLAAAACRTAPARHDVPAVITEPSARSRAELEQAVSAALNGASVTLRDDALTHEDALIVERIRHRDPNGILIEGRDMGRPERFHLVKNGTECVLVHENTGRRFPLSQTTCAAI
jgi:hypothetical protein